MKFDSYIQPTNALIIKLYFSNTIRHKSDIFGFILIIFRELLNINKLYTKNMNRLLHTLKFVHKMFIDTIKTVAAAHYDVEIV